MKSLKNMWITDFFYTLNNVCSDKGVLPQRFDLALSPPLIRLSDLMDEKFLNPPFRTLKQSKIEELKQLVL